MAPKRTGQSVNASGETLRNTQHRCGSKAKYHLCSPIGVPLVQFGSISFSILHQFPQRDQSSQTEAEPASDELLCISQEEDTPSQRCNEHEGPTEAR